MLSLVDAAERYVSANVRRRFVIESGTREEVPEIPRAAVREAVLNAFAHRDYDVRATVAVDVLTDTVEVTSPGLFPARETPEDYLEGRTHQSIKRNEHIADALYRRASSRCTAAGSRASSSPARRRG